MHMEAALLAGGEGRRALSGRADAYPGKLDIEVCGIPLGLRSYTMLSGAFPDPIVICRKGNVPRCLAKLGIAYDSVDVSGPAAGMIAALELAEDWCFIAAADMPFLDRSLIALMATEVMGLPQGVLCAVPSWRKGYEPLHAFYRGSAIGGIIGYSKSGKRSLMGLTEALGAHRIDAEEAAMKCGADIERAFFNLNSPEDFSHAERLIGCTGDRAGDRRQDEGRTGPDR